MHKEDRPIEFNGRTFKRVVCWFSAGSASAVATNLALHKYGKENCVVVYQDTGSEHPDNARFIRQFEETHDIKIEIIKSEKYSDIWDVFQQRRYIVGIAGAPCTTELKRMVAERYLNFFDDLEVLGYTSEESNRLDKWVKNNEERFIDPILITMNYDKHICHQIIQSLNIELPAMYKLGYQNNNCIGCVKGQSGYWNKIRKDFPEVFDRMAKLERTIGAAICKTEPLDPLTGKRQRIPVYLDELDPNAGRYLDEPPMTCGFLCGADE
jgi:3'-phosphoadenosine 5'-phosphosulfate sulfotransferase (PAPS reductase)/FAD synthetase